MRINVLEIHYKNIREMKDLTVDLCDSGAPKHISLIQMPNGVGKTTTMELIRYCLDKGAESLDEAKILSFKPPRTDAKKGEFRVKFDMDGQIKIVTLRFDYENASVRYATTSTEQGGEVAGLELGHEMEPWLKNKEFVRLFVFDGELAGQLLSSESTSAEEAINALYHLYNLRYLYEDDGVIDHLLLERITGGVQTNQGKKALNTKLENAMKTKKRLEEERDRLTLRDSALKRKIKEAQDKIDASRSKDKQLIKEYEELKSQDKILENNIIETTEKLLNAMRVPHNISNDISTKLTTLATQMGKLKLPKTQSMEFFEELSECAECICGRQIGEAERKTIKERAKSFLTEDNIGEINAIKTSIRNLPERENLSELIGNIKELSRKRKLNERQILTLDSRTKGKEIIGELTEKIRALSIKERETADLLRVLNETRKEEQQNLGLTWQDNIELCAKQIAEWQNQLATATNTVAFKNKALVLKDILQQINERSLVKLKENILIKTNERIEKILKSKDIRISKIGSCLSLSDRPGVSEGQKLSIAYAFLSTLFNQSPHDLPFIVDTPAAPLDLSVRREVAEILPDLFKQVVVFITSGERNGFAERFYSQAQDCLFLTIRKDEDGVYLENDLEFFKNFQSED